jgi:mono/diheme cytochrome c family protein
MKYRLMAFLLVAGATSRAADQGAALFKAKCAVCHGAKGEGKAVMKAPALKGTKMDVNQLVEHLTKGEPTSKAPHNRGIAGLSEAQARAVAEYVKTIL